MITYEEKLKIYSEMFHPFGLPYNYLVELQNLVGLICLGVRKKDPNIKVLDVFSKLVDTKRLSIHEYFAIQFSIQLEVLLKDPYFFTPTSYGLKTKDQIVARIAEILEKEWVPF